MTASIPKIRLAVTTARFAVLAFALALAACETDGTGPTAADAPKAEAAGSKTEAKIEPSKTEASKPEPKAQAAKPAEPVVDSEPMTHSRAARE